MAHRIEEMAKLGTFKGFEGEDSIPHFHFRNFQDGRKDFDNIVIKGGNFASDEEVENQVRLVNELSR